MSSVILPGSEYLLPGSEYLVIRKSDENTLSNYDIQIQIENLHNMKRMIELSNVHFMRPRWDSYLERHSPNYNTIYDTVFEFSPNSYILSRVYSDSFDMAFYIVNDSLKEYHPLKSLDYERVELSFSDATVPFIRNTIPGISKLQALAIIDRWLFLMAQPLNKKPSRGLPLSLLNYAKAFVGNVASEAKKHGLPDYTLPNYDEEDGLHVHMVEASFPTAHHYPQITFNAVRDDDWDTDYRYLNKTSASIYACALPHIIQIEKCWLWGGVGQESHYDRNSIYSITFGPWTSPDILFEPNSILQGVMDLLPSVPRGSIIPPKNCEK